MNDLKRYQSEEFNKIYPELKRLLSRFELSETTNSFKVAEFEFIASMRNGVIEFSFSSEKSIFPTLVFKPLNDSFAELLYYRFDEDLMKQLLYRFETLNEQNILESSQENNKQNWAQELVDNLNQNVKKDSEWLEKNQPEIIKRNLRERKDYQRKLIQKVSLIVILSIFLIIVIGSYSKSAQSQVVNFNNSPNNWTNSPNNWDNSPNNFNNSPNNFSATNGVYDNSGNRLGYEVQAPSGVINYFDNSGNRIGYKPTGK